MTATTHEDIRVGEMVIRFLLEGEESGGAIAVFEFDVPAGARVASAHSHDGYDETIYGVEGTLTWRVEGVPVDVGPGEALFIPRGTIHHFDNPHDADAKALAVVTPGILGPDFFREVGSVLAASAGGPPDVVSLGEIMLRHGLTPAPSTHPSES
jgi:quercetin dioxygenase-like cupin family protein